MNVSKWSCVYSYSTIPYAGLRLVELSATIMYNTANSGISLKITSETLKVMCGLSEKKIKKLKSFTPKVMP